MHVVRHDEPDCDQKLLRRRKRPEYEKEPDPVRVVDLFCGCGGMTLGAAEGAYRAGRGIEISLAVDADPDAVKVFAHNFPDADVRESLVEAVIDGKLGSDGRTSLEAELVEQVGEVDLLLGGPPCQGHSDLNNHTRRDDPRNALYARMARATEVLAPRAVIVENVPGALRDSQRVVEATEEVLRQAGYAVAHRVIRLVDIGVPQHRRRHVLLGLVNGPDPDEVLDGLEGGSTGQPHRTVRWAIGDLEKLTEPEHDFDRASRITEVNRERIAWLFENEAFDLPNKHRPKCHQNEHHTYKSMYGRLKWDEPAQTITTGFGSMGQGRFVHPARQRTLTPHEAARLQFLPDFLDLTVVTRRTAWARMIGNAVPVPLTMRLVELLLATDILAREPAESTPDAGWTKDREVV